MQKPLYRNGLLDMLFKKIVSVIHMRARFCSNRKDSRELRIHKNGSLYSNMHDLRYTSIHAHDLVVSQHGGDAGPCNNLLFQV